MSLKRSDKNNGNGASADAGDDAPKLRDNVEINAKIDSYIKANPKEWDYIQKSAAGTLGTHARPAERQQARTPRTRPH